MDTHTHARSQTSPYFLFVVVFSLLCLIDWNYSGTPSLVFGFIFMQLAFAFIYYHCCSGGPLYASIQLTWMRPTFKLFASFRICLKKCVTTHDNSILVWNIWTLHFSVRLCLCVFEHENWYNVSAHARSGDYLCECGLCAGVFGSVSYA